MVLARLVDLELPPEQPIDLLTVAFGATPDEAPDRLTARNGLAELASISPSRPWRMVEIDISLEMLHEHRLRLEALLLPARTVMDLNIGAALWFGARGVGFLRTRAPEQASPHPLPTVLTYDSPLTTYLLTLASYHLLLITYH